MFDFFRKAVRANLGKNESAADDGALAGMHLRLGGTIRLDALPFQMLKDHLLFRVPEGDQPVEAYGHVNLGASAELHRFYLTDDAWLQVNLTDSQIDEMKYWIFYDTKHPATRAAFNQWIETGGQIGSKQIELEGKLFRRVWGENATWAPPIPLVEDVYSESADSVSYQTNHSSMLYERKVHDSERMEYLLISAELTDGEYCVVFNIGVDVSTADLSIN